LPASADGVVFLEIKILKNIVFNITFYWQDLKHQGKLAHPFEVVDQAGGARSHHMFMRFTNARGRAASCPRE
jgi:hypothetical protein